MKVIPNGSGWDIAFDMVFTDKATASTIAQRIAPLSSTLVRDAVDASMCERLSVPRRTRVNPSAADSESEGQELHSQALQPTVKVAPSVYSIAARVRAMGLSVSLGAD